MRPRSARSGTCPALPGPPGCLFQPRARPSRSPSSDDVRPGSTADLLAALVGRDRLEDVVPASVSFGDVLDASRRRDLVARDPEWAPLELLGAVEHHREVQLALRAEDRRG